jgi:spore coat polysaccharide biosynthesis predicted glycosyltransferase SpsG
MTVVIRVDGGPEIGYGHLIHSASAYPRLQARVKRTIAYTPTDDGTAGFPTVCDSFKPLGRHSV